MKYQLLKLIFGQEQWEMQIYYLNIDSINIYSRMSKDKDSDFMDVFTNYNISIINGEINRANQFCKVYGDGDIKTGQDKIKDIVESWSPGVEYLAEKHKITIPYLFGCNY